MQIESIEGFTEVCGRKKKNVKKLTANLNIKKSPEEENNNLKDEGFATASPTESEESLGKSSTLDGLEPGRICKKYSDRI